MNGQNVDENVMKKRTVLQFLGNTEVGNLDATFVVDQNVRTLDIPMDNAPFMYVVETVQDLSDKVPYKWLLEGTVVAEKSSD